MNFTEPLLQRPTGFGVFHFGEKKEMSPAEMTQGLAENTPGQKMLVSESERRINEQNVKISMEAKILKAIIKQDPSYSESLECYLTISGSIFADEDRNLWEPLSHEKRFIA
jgi:hypothetical protein